MRTYKFECINCDCNFNIGAKYLLKKSDIVCPSCSSKLPDNAFEKLKALALALNEYDENHPNATDVGTKNHFYLTIV